MTGFAGFRGIDVTVDGVRVHARVGGDGPPLLLLHGYPQTHAMWHAVAPGLARTRTVVAPDLRGYGHSAKPVATPDHATYSKRAMAADQVGLMRALGFDRFDVVGHDRGARVTHRMALDHRQAVRSATVLDIVPTRHAYAHVDRALAEAYNHWFFLSSEPDLPERLLAHEPHTWVRRKLRQWSADGFEFDGDAVHAYAAAFSEPASIAATCEDYRAGATIDLEHDEVDARAGAKVAAPLLVLWGREGFVGRRYDVLDVWRDYADDVRGKAVPGGHFVPEEAPTELLAELTAFLA